MCQWSSSKPIQGDTVLYEIGPEKKHRVTAVDVAGNKQIPASKLDPSITVQKAHLFSHGKFSNNLRCAPA